MSMSKKTSYTNEFKGKVALDAIKSDKTIAELVMEYNVASSFVKCNKLLTPLEL